MKIAKLAALALCCAIMGSASAFAAVAAPDNPLTAFDNAPRRAHSEIRQVRGTILRLEPQQVLVRTADGSEICANLSPATYIVQGEQGKLRLPRALEVGQDVVLYHSARLTRSLPPQAAAYALVLGGEEEYLPQFISAADAKLSADGSAMHVLSANGDLIVTLDAQDCDAYASIAPGAKLLVWSRMMTMSMPGLTHAEKAVLLP